MRGPSSAASKAYTIELAPLVNRVLAAGGDTLSLNIWRNPSDSRFFIFYSKDYAVEAWRPRLLVTPRVDTALTTRKPVQQLAGTDPFVQILTKSRLEYEIW